MPGILAEGSDVSVRELRDDHGSPESTLVRMAGKQGKATSQNAANESAGGWRTKAGQFIQAFRMQLRDDKALIPWLVGTFVVVAGVVFGIGVSLGNQWFLLPLGIILALLVDMIIFGRRVQRNVFAKAEGQPGAAGWALQNMRGSWNVSQGVSGTAQLDVVHRVVGRPGVVLVAEGAPHRVKGLLAQEKKRVARMVGSTPIYDVVVGNEQGQVPLRRLQSHVTKLPRNISKDQVDSLNTRLSALSKGGAAMPKGPVPQGAKVRSPQRTVKRR
jgi:hypothetical protein